MDIFNPNSYRDIIDNATRKTVFVYKERLNRKNYPLSIFQLSIKMSVIHLTTFIAAPVERVFDLSRSINLHHISMSSSNEKAISQIGLHHLRRAKALMFLDSTSVKLRLLVTSSIVKNA